MDVNWMTLFRPIINSEINLCVGFYMRNICSQHRFKTFKIHVRVFVKIIIFTYELHKRIIGEYKLRNIQL